MKSRDIIQEVRDSPVFVIHRQATMHIKNYLDNNHENELPPEGVGVDLLISSQFTAALDYNDKITGEMVKVIMPWIESMYWKYQKAMLEEERE